MGICSYLYARLASWLEVCVEQKGLFLQCLGIRFKCTVVQCTFQRWRLLFYGRPMSVLQRLEVNVSLDVELGSRSESLVKLVDKFGTDILSLFKVSENT